MQRFYNALGAKEEDTPETIRKKWIKQCKAHHPDKGGDPEKFREVTHAYKMITDSSYRHTQKDQDPIERLHVVLRHPISFEDAFFGKSVTFTVNQIEFDSSYTPIVKEKEDLVTITINIPSGTMGEFRHIAPGKGCKLGEKSGDLVIMLAANIHPRFKVSGLDVVTEEKVPLDVMLKGGKLDIETMYGIKTLVIPPGSQPGAKLKIKKCGVNKVGHHYVVASVVFPNEAELKTKPAWKEMGIKWDENQPEDDPQEEMFINLFDTLSKGKPHGRNTAGL